MKIFKNGFLKLGLMALFAASALLTLAPMPADAGISFSTAIRTGMMQSIVTDAGAGAKLKLYGDTGSGCTVPSGVAAAPVGCTLQATLTFGAAIGTATAGTIDWDEGGVSQTNGSHVNGTPKFAHITTAADAVVARIDMCTGSNAPCWTFTGTVANGQNVTLTGLVFTAGNP